MNIWKWTEMYDNERLEFEAQDMPNIFYISSSKKSIFLHSP